MITAINLSIYSAWDWKSPKYLTKCTSRQKLVTLAQNNGGEVAVAHLMMAVSNGLWNGMVRGMCRFRVLLL